MPNLLKECKQCFDSKNLYDVLGIDKTASDEESKWAILQPFYNKPSF